MSRDRGGVGRASALLASGTIISRLLGFTSALVLAAALGQGTVGDTFALANQLPNNIYAIIAGGLLSAILVPQIVRAEKHPDGGQQYINRLVTLGLSVFLLIAIISTLGAPWLVDLYSQQGANGLDARETQLANLFAYWCLPQIFFYAVYSLLGEVLNARRLFGPFTWAPIINNVVAIGGLFAFIALYGRVADDASATTIDGSMIALIGGTATLGVATQALFLAFFWKRAGLTYRPDFRWRGVGLGSAGKAAAWTFAMILVTQLAGIVQNDIVSRASGDGASYSTLRFSWLIFMLPHSIAAVSIATAYFTRMSASARDHDLTSVRADLSSSLRSVGLVLVFSAVGLIVLAYPFSALFANSFVVTEQMAHVLIFYLLGLVQFSVLFVLQRTYYALEDTRTPFFFTVVQSSLFVIGALYVGTWPEERIGIGIAAVTSIAGTVQLVLAATILHRRLGGIDGARVAKSYAWYFAASAPAAAVGVVLLLALGGTTEGGFAVDSKPTAALSMVLIGSAMGLVYLAALVFSRNPELGAVARPIVARLRRRR